MKKSVILFLILCLLLTASGCSQEASEPAQPGVVEFQLGNRVFVERGKEIPYPMDGLIGIPEGTNCPVVFILHGAHPVEDVTEDRYYKGFEYLVSELAKEGYLAVSINVNRAYSLEPVEGNEEERSFSILSGYMDMLRKANNGEKVLETDITDKVDLSRISFIGHSRGGDNSMLIAKRLLNDNQNVDSVLMIGSPILSENLMSPADVPTAIILPQYDEDVKDLNSQYIFNEAYRQKEQRRSPVAAAYLLGANHARFNTKVNDNSGLNTYEAADYISEETQRDFLIRYAKDFLSLNGKKDVDYVKLLGNNAPESYNMDFLPSVYISSGSRLIDPVYSKSEVLPDGMDLDYVQQTAIPAENTAAPFNHPGVMGNMKLPLYRIAWEKPTAELTFKATLKNWKDYSYLSLFMANDSTNQSNRQKSNEDEANIKQKPLAFDVELTDGEGNSSRYNLDSSKDSALRYIPSSLTNVFEGLNDMEPLILAEYPTPLSTQIIPLSFFSDINMEDIRQVRILPTSSSGAIMLRGIDLY